MGLYVTSPVNPAVNQAQAVQRQAAQRQAVRAQRTQTDPNDFREALSRAYKNQTGKEASSETLDVLSAHVALETGSGRRMYNYNFGGIKGHGPSGLTANYGTHEYVGRRRVAMKQGFRAYQNLDEGAADYLKFMSGRYKEALAAAEEGDVSGFASKLKERRYYTAPLKQYARGLQRLVDHGPLPMPAGQASAPAPMPIDPLQSVRIEDELAHQHTWSLPTISVVRAIHDAAAKAAVVAEPNREAEV